MRLNLGVTYLNSGDSQRAYETLVEAKRLYDRGESVQAFPRIGAFIHYNLGAVLYARKQYDEAAAAAAAQPRARRPVPGAAADGEHAAQPHRRATRRLGGGGDRMEEALKYHDDPDWRVDLAQMMMRSGNVIGANMVIDATLKKYPGLPRALKMKERIAAEAAAAPRPAGAPAEGPVAVMSTAAGWRGAGRCADPRPRSARRS